MPLLDLALLAAGVWQLSGNGGADEFTGLGAVYLGFTVAFGHSMIRWADQRFARRFAGGPPPWKPPRYGRARARHEWREFGKMLVAAGISAALLGGGILLVGDVGRAGALVAWLDRLALVTGVWFLIALSYTVFPRRAPSEDRA